jgi:ATP diphosphatase
VRDADEVVRNWRRIKADERKAAGGDGGVLAAVPPALPGLARAQQAGEKLAQVGFDWSDLSGVLAKLDEERGELAEAIAAGDRTAITRELGDLLLTLTSVARHLEVDAEMAVRDATTRLGRRVAHVEAAARAQARAQVELEPAERDRLWDEAKGAG